MSNRIRCVVMRGGTSRGLFFHMDDLPGVQGKWQELFCRAMGTPDSKQVDGLGGGTSSTSKVAIIKKSEQPGIDVEYTFVQVGVGENTIDMSGNCGNISSAVAPFAVDEGLVDAVEPFTWVTTFNTNTDKIIKARVRVRNGKFDPDGDCSIPGLVQRGSEILMEYFEPEGSVTGKLFPTGRAVDEIEVGGRSYNITVIDCTNPYVFIMAGELGMSGYETPPEIDASDNLRILQDIRDLAGKMLGIDGPAFPKICVLSSPGARPDKSEGIGGYEEMDIIARTISMGKTHKTIPLTGAFALAAASSIEGTIPYMLYRGSIILTEAQVRIGHPEGVISIGVSLHDREEKYKRIRKVSAVRTARRIMEGYIYI